MPTSHPKSLSIYALTIPAAMIVCPTPIASAADPTAPTGADRPTVQRDPTNAALVYSRAWQLLPDDLAKREMNLDDPAWVPDAELAQLLVARQSFIQCTLRAAAIENADWGIEYSQGLNALLPHLGKLRQTARLLASDARRLTQLSDSISASHRIAALFALASHCSHDGTMISSLVGCAIARLGASEAERLLQRGTVGSEPRAILLAGLDRLSGPDPFGAGAAIDGERFFLNWVERHAQGPESAAELTGIFADMKTTPETTEALERLNRLNPSGRKAAFLKAHEYYSALSLAWELPAEQSSARIAELEKNIDDYGVVARLLAPAVSKCQKANRQAIADLHACRAAILANPASPADPSTPPSSTSAPPAP